MKRPRLRAWFTLLATLILVAAAALGVYRLTRVQASAALPVAPARKVDFQVIVRARGELKSGRSVTIYAPIVPSLRIASLSPSGESIAQGQLVVKFDSSASEQQLQQKEAALRQAQATLDQAVAQAKITQEQDKSDLADARYTVERARLQAARNEIVSRIQGEESKIDYNVAQQKLKVQEATVALHAASDKSKIASLTRVRDQAQADVDLTKARIAQMEVKSPIAGMIIYGQNYAQGWMNAKPFKVGDNVFAGMVLADMPDLSTLQMDAKIEETDRGRLSAGQDVHVRIDSLPELTIPAKIGAISLLAETSNEFPPVRSFRGYCPIPNPDPRLRPGMNGGVDIIINRIPKAISIPAKALFTHSGKPIVYIADKGQYRPNQVEVLARNPDEVAVKGLPTNTMVTLVDPEAKESRK